VEDERIFEACMASSRDDNNSNSRRSTSRSVGLSRLAEEQPRSLRRTKPRFRAIEAANRLVQGGEVEPQEVLVLGFCRTLREVGGVCDRAAGPHFRHWVPCLERERIGSPGLLGRGFRPGGKNDRSGILALAEVCEQKYEAQFSGCLPQIKWAEEFIEWCCPRNPRASVVRGILGL